MPSVVRRPSRAAPRAAVALVASTLTVACYGERLPPPTFRFDCDSDQDCAGTERCRDGLCQIPCTTDTFNDDCPSGEGFAMCFNGVCSHLCPTDEAVCPPPQACLELPVEAPSGGGGFGGGGGEDLSLGICGVLCEDDDGCPGGETCLLGICIPSGGGGTTDGGGTGTDVTGTEGGSGS